MYSVREAQQASTRGLLDNSRGGHPTTYPHPSSLKVHLRWCYWGSGSLPEAAMDKPWPQNRSVYYFNSKELKNVRSHKGAEPEQGLWCTPTLQGCGLGQVGLKAAGMGVRDQAHLERPCWAWADRHGRWWCSVRTRQAKPVQVLLSVQSGSIVHHLYCLCSLLFSLNTLEMFLYQWAYKSIFNGLWWLCHTII